VLDRGLVAERGTHEELIEAGGRYCELLDQSG
jgi:ABC-type multidrug transport system fused ATPase/permease subunit